MTTEHQTTQPEINETDPASTEEIPDVHDGFLIWDNTLKWQWRYWWKWGVLWFAFTYLALWASYTRDLFPVSAWMSFFSNQNNSALYVTLTGLRIALFITGLQWLLLRKHLLNAYLWIIYSVVGYIAAEFVLFMLSTNIETLLKNAPSFVYAISDFSNLEMQELYLLGILTLGGVIVILFQVFALNTYFVNTYPWILFMLLGNLSFHLLLLLLQNLIYAPYAPSIPGWQMVLIRHLSFAFFALCATAGMLYLLQREYEIDAIARGMIEMEE